MKFSFLILFLNIIDIRKMYKDCGYREKPAQDMEAEFDECLSRNNGES